MLSQSPQAAYLRIASLSIGLYDYIRTLPAEYRFYRAQKSFLRLSQQCILFILIRYSSISVMAISNVGFFAVFTVEQCNHFYIVSPVVKAIQTLVSQIILAVRTYSISKRARWVWWTMLIMLVVCVPLEFFLDVYRRTPVGEKLVHNCTSGNSSANRIAWGNYVVAMVFDLVAVGIATSYLWIYSSKATRMSHFLRTLLYEGMGYFVVLTAANILNIILYRNPHEFIQSSGVSIGYVVIWIMSQRILIHQRDAAEQYASKESEMSTRSRSLDTSREINRALRSQYSDQKASHLKTSSLKVPDFVASSLGRSRPVAQDDTASVELEVQVRVEETVRVCYDEDSFDREDYRKPRVMWDSQPPQIIR